MGGRGTIGNKKAENAAKAERARKSAGGGGGGDDGRAAQRGGGGGDLPVNFSDKFTVERDKGVDEGLASIFGKSVSDRELGRMVGAADGAKIKARMDARGQVRVEVDHEYYGQVRYLGKDGDNPYLVNAAFEKKEGAPRRVGTAILANQVSNARRAGIKYIDTWAAGEFGSSMNGYYTWAVLGFDGEFTSAQMFKLPQYYKDKGVKTVQGLMKTKGDGKDIPDGAEWWKRNGSEWGGRFDLSDGSDSIKILNEYLRRGGLNLPFKL